jgi:type I restriction enzyme M protein
MSPTTQSVQKLWNYCNVLRDDGMSYGDYPSARLRAGVEQSAFFLEHALWRNP